MSDRSYYRSWLARASILLATLVFVTGSAIEPVVHSMLAANAAAATDADGSSAPDPDTPDIHDELSCAVCQAFGALTASPATELTVAPSIFFDGIVSLPQIVPLSPTHSAHRPRAPPLV